MALAKRKPAMRRTPKPQIIKDAEPLSEAEQDQLFELLGLLGATNPRRFEAIVDRLVKQREASFFNAWITRRPSRNGGPGGFFRTACGKQHETVDEASECARGMAYMQGEHVIYCDLGDVGAFIRRGGHWIPDDESLWAGGAGAGVAHG